MSVRVILLTSHHPSINNPTADLRYVSTVHSIERGAYSDLGIGLIWQACHATAVRLVALEPWGSGVDSWAAVADPVSFLSVMGAIGEVTRGLASIARS